DSFQHIYLVSPLFWLRADFIKGAWPHQFSRNLTLKIKSNKKCSTRLFRDLASAFLYEYSYNTGISLISQRHLPAYSRTRSALRRRRSEEIDPPRRIYDEELVHYYLMAVSSASP